ncbi:4Fe-4S dicluster domain-containing protein [Desulfurobacterium sp.]
MKDLLGREVKDLSEELWWGVKRKEIEWYPTINYEKCIGCGICFITCGGKKVFDWDIEKNRPIVARPYNCMVGCTTCRTLCPVDAISFPDKSYIRKLVKELNILQKAKERIEKAVSSQKG